MSHLFLVRALAAAACAAGLIASAHASQINLSPLHAGSFASGSGADATFVQIDGSWQGSRVLWNEATRSYGSGNTIGSYAWGTGIWGQADWQAVQNAAAGLGGAGAPGILTSWSGLSSAINYGNGCYNGAYSSQWGQATAVPLADNGVCGNDANGNWTSHFEGYIRITEEGLYNFSVLYDDGFFFRLLGAEETLEIGKDYLNARDRLGFAEDLFLTPGLYGFELGSWNRLQAGVVDLRYSYKGSDWTLVDPQNLLPTSAVPEPSTLALLLPALAMLGLRRTIGRRA
ncbi:PEP-CTERM sorting domain-containing protein [Rubrivivax gelatinosus]|nr:PEP-CTERM sorting domain-containing protein [Rubrivivax gelatinosus]